MKEKLPLFIFSKQFTDYFFNQEHPFNQKRLLFVKKLLEEMGYLNHDRILSPREASDKELACIHDQVYLEAVKRYSSLSKKEINLAEADLFGLGTEDTPIFANMHQATSLIVGGALAGADAIMQGKTDKAFHVAGGLHHAFRGKASGFCVYNDCAVAIQYLKERYGLKVLYIDVDAHHGDGVQFSFYDDPDVFTFSIHETGRYLFPGTGHLTERGEGLGYGYALNLAMDAYTEDHSWISSFAEGLAETLHFFKPDIIVSQHGCDAHYLDPLTHLSCSMRSFVEIPELIREAANSYTGGKWLALGGGGYDIYRVVPRAWSILWMIMNNIPVDQRDLPTAWLQYMQEEMGVAAELLPSSLLDEAGEHPLIPRREEIEEKNKIMTKKALQLIRHL